MNRARRKEIERAAALLDEAKQIIETAQSDEQDYYDNMPESLQNGERGEKAQASADALQEAFDAIEEAATACGAAIE